MAMWPLPTLHHAHGLEGITASGLSTGRCFACSKVKSSVYAVHATMRSYPAIGDGTACLIVLLVISGPWFLVCHLSWQVVSNWDAG